MEARTENDMPNGTGAQPIDLAELEAATEGDRELQEELIVEYVGDCESRLATIRTALGEDNPVSIRNEAHSIKGASGAVGAPEMMAIAAELEGLAREGDVAGCGEVIERLGVEFARVKRFCRPR